MSNKLYSLKLLFLIQIITVFGEKFEVKLGQTSTKTESESQEKRAVPQDELVELLPDKVVGPLPPLNGFLPNLPSINKSEKVWTDKQLIDKHPRTRVIQHTEIDAIYNCTTDSVLSLLAFHSEFENYFTCSQVLEIPHENRLNATFRRLRTKSNEPFTHPMITYDSSVKIVFFKGNQMYHSTGRVEGGPCNGNILTIMNVSMVKKGSCQNRSGVQQIVSEYALLTLSGKCQSTCFGDVNISVNPGLRF